MLLCNINVMSGRKKLSTGAIILRHRGGGLRKKYRLVDFSRGISYYVSFQVIDLMYDPRRSANIALILYASGIFSYILATVDMYRYGIFGGYSQSSMLKSGSINFLNMYKRGNLVNSITMSHLLVVQNKFNISLDIQMQKGRAVFARSAGAGALILGPYYNKYMLVKLSSGSLRLIAESAFCVSGQISNVTHKMLNKRKAGVSRLLNIRPTVRGVAMNPVDHPHGGGEGKSSGGRHPVSPWGRLTKDHFSINFKSRTSFFHLFH